MKLRVVYSLTVYRDNYSIAVHRLFRRKRDAVRAYRSYLLQFDAKHMILRKLDDCECGWVDPVDVEG